MLHLLGHLQCAGKAVIIMDAQCMIQAANQVAHNVFGYGKNELRGRNINILIPP
jgi:PAS domain S-box-containing protein